MSSTQPVEGDDVYVDLAFKGVEEGRVIAAGERYEVRLLSGGTTTVPEGAVWTAPELK